MENILPVKCNPKLGNFVQNLTLLYLMNHTVDDLLALKKTVDDALEANRNLSKKIVQQKTESVLHDRITVLSRWNLYRRLWSKS